MSNCIPENKNGKHGVFIVDDHPIVRQGLVQLISQETGFMVCGDAGDVSGVLEAIAERKPDIVIVDLSLGHASGIRLIEDISRSDPDLPVLVLSMHDESLYAERCLRAGARGYVMKKEPPEKVISALNKIVSGDIYISEKLGAKLLHKLISRNPGVSSSPVESLSNRELEVFQLIGQGLKTRKIAEQLGLSVKTIETYIEHIKKKMHLNDSRDLFLRAVKWLMKDNMK